MLGGSCRRLLGSPLAAAAWLFLSALALQACGGTVPGPSGPPQATAPATPSATAIQPPAPVVPQAPTAPTAAAGKTRIALLLPLSGANAALGSAMLDAAQMALFDVADNALELMPHDTQGTPQGAADAAKAALGEGAKLIIGPLIAAEVEAVKPVAHGAGVPVLAFSTSTQLAGDGTYLMGFLPQQEIQRVTAFAHAKGVNRFAVLAPRTAYGEVAVAALRGAVAAQNATLGRIDFYDPAAPDLTAAAKSFAAGAQDAEAVLLPEGGARLKTLAPLLPYDGIDPAKVHFLGTGLWDEPGLGTEPSLDGGWYAAPPPASRADFEKRFADLYHHPPPRLATLAYDATALAAVLAHGQNGPDLSAQALTNPSGFAGIDGIFRLRPDGLVERGLAVLEVEHDGDKVIDPAPTTFQSIGQ
ncbi:MAG TPA: penicillin-binding protein activator [Stellaceae bacterium]|nr:penicillin-binding protein activator [Stellaceae bacterium]